MLRLRAKYDGRTTSGRRKYTLRNSHAADQFQARARLRGYRSESNYLTLGRIEVQVLTDAENRRAWEREMKDYDRDRGTY